MARNTTLTTEEFIHIWEGHDSLEGIEAAIAAVYTKAGLKPMSRATIAAKAGQLRSKGVMLSKKKVGPKSRTDLSGLNDLAERARAAGAGGQSPSVPAPPPPPDPSEVIRAMLAELRKGKD